MISVKTKLIIAGLVLAVFLISNSVVGWKFYNIGKAHTKAEWDKAIADNVNTKIDTKVKQDEVRNAPIDNDTTDRRMLDGSF